MSAEAFAKEIIRDSWEGCDGGDIIQELAVKHGLIRREPYDPAVHGANAVCEPGDDFFVFDGPLGENKEVAQWQVLGPDGWTNEDADWIERRQNQGYQVRALFEVPQTVDAMLAAAARVGIEAEDRIRQLGRENRSLREKLRLAEEEYDVLVASAKLAVSP